MKKPYYKDLPIPAGCLHIEPNEDDRIFQEPVLHANVVQMNHTNTDVYIWFGEGVPPFLAHDEKDLPKDYNQVFGKTIGLISLPISCLYGLRTIIDDQLRVYKSRFGNYPYLTKWHDDQIQEAEENNKIKVLKEMGWIKEDE